MNLCAYRHEEICFDGNDCPMCAMKKELYGEIKQMESKIEDLKSEIERLQNLEE